VVGKELLGLSLGFVGLLDFRPYLYFAQNVFIL
jgi:hypothetical protein